MRSVLRDFWSGGQVERLMARARALFESSVRAGVPHFVASVFSLQGVAYLAQLAIARHTGPSDFAVIRTVEAVLSLVLVLASVTTAQQVPQPMVRTSNFIEVGNDVFMHIMASADIRYKTVHKYPTKSFLTQC